jgi:hypothetical protein
MQLVVVTHKATEADKEVILKWAGSLEIDRYYCYLPTEKIETYIGPDKVYMTFGLVASRIVKQTLSEKNIIADQLELPAPPQLVGNTENKAIRAKAYKELKEFEKLVIKARPLVWPSSIVVTDADLPDLSYQQILMMKKMATIEGRIKCIQISKNKKLVEIGPEDSWSDEADIHMTFEELLTIRSAMNTLKVDEVRLVLSEKVSNLRNRGSTQVCGT